MPSGLSERRNKAGLALQKLSSRAQEKPVIKRLEPEQKITDFFTIEESIQELENRAVYKCSDKASGKPLVMKIRNKKSDDYFFRQVTEKVMSMPKAQNVLSFEAVYEDDAMYYMVMDRCNAGELFSLLMTEDAIAERECKRIMREILLSVQHLHDEGLLHRDIKPENLLLHQDLADPTDPNSPGSPGSPKVIKLIDFDTSQSFGPTSPKSKSVVGTHGYIAPEAYKGEYTQASDLWSVGVIFYVLMTGDMPFENALFDNVEECDNTVGRGIEGMCEVLQNEKIDWECPPWPDFPMARDLCQRLLAFEPEARSPTAKDALNHPWLAS